MDDFRICGIQQIGVGVPDLALELRWCRTVLGTDVRIFEDEGEAQFMLPYTGGAPQARKAILVVNLQGGAGLEIWQFTRRETRPPGFTVRPGDLGIYRTRIKARDPVEAWARMEAGGVQGLGPLQTDPLGEPTFLLRDPLGLEYQVVPGLEWFAGGSTPTGGVSGCAIGVSSMERSLLFYQRVLGYDQVLYDREGSFEDCADPGGGASRFRRVLLGHTAPRTGAFSPILGSSRLELMQCIDRAPRRIFADRFWGDLGFIHLCFDVRGMDALKAHCDASGAPFAVDSGAFSMGDAAGRFAYVEDPDGTLIELVETSRLPVMKQWGWYIDLRRRPPEKPLPRWMLRSLGLNRIRD
jgi:catechol 2,3-dioxygenase-like lactoylglutathione lyase family enzyme